MNFGYVTENGVGVNSNYFAPDLVRINKDGLQMDRKILTYDSVEISFGGKAVVHDVSFSLDMEKYLVLWGNQAVEKHSDKSCNGTSGIGWPCDKRRYPIYGSEYPG